MSRFQGRVTDFRQRHAIRWQRQDKASSGVALSVRSGITRFDRYRTDSGHSVRSDGGGAIRQRVVSNGSEMSQTASAAGRQKYPRAHGPDRAISGPLPNHGPDSRLTIT
jgi:hypothetical protein